MAEEKKQSPEQGSPKREHRPEKRGIRRGRNPRKPREDDGLEQKIVDLARVTRVMQGGKRMRFRACVAVGDGKGKIGIGMAKGADITLAIQKAVTKAKKTMVRIPLKNETLPHVLEARFKAAHILLKPAPKGTGVKAGGVVRILLELGHVPNASAKILGTSNKVTNARAFMNSLDQFMRGSRGEKTASTAKKTGTAASTA
ncbi:MAG: 30S ribosomal protein S5 [Parcubacteria group bacterium CG08_land_8_20_14_0_20_48_21]|nr:MAG: 30S ribosomal protein S5 [Parcubacteria group bacterium CG08_land_8_20_14_0_20_48_21]PIW79304.1 MAG: 30S ribosomal protein S5 [Parcubacteria group bacterium CG_4_8_14_3_um_filter_48_16]PIY77605.1 MAG: 30S ribosomal protein S5 [Parcubacteria group bacterium CG_4_10_14_0_8_um_filter_48_154]PIZ77190.1 MAG: 30S ribosomal protein S5 [bacterium CG_4_10_14_0_2_um_filter_48_144]PJC40144.1 MAG: 30S ribosomal protein S5 [Parcubacteria group bacterium CG_4_9_14_0_2_um_filter_48_40]PJE52713.1 MAG: